MDHEISTLEIRRIACDHEVQADPRSVRRELDQPGSVRGMVGERIRRALAKRGIVPQHHTVEDRDPERAA